MDFKAFTNGQGFQEYILIFCYSKILLDQKPIDEVTIHDYPVFELTDKIIESYNDWVGRNCPQKGRVGDWLAKNQDQYDLFREKFGTDYQPKVSLWSDRHKTDYYKGKLQDAFLFESHIATLLQEQYGLDLGPYLTPEGQYNLGENALGIEIKNDTLIAKYGNVYIEYQEKSNAFNYTYVDSGILKNDNCKYFLIGTAEKFYIFKKERLVEIYHEERLLQNEGKSSQRGITFKQIATSRGYVYPVRIAVQDTVTLDEMVESILQELK